jgi:hypothetical protein
MQDSLIQDIHKCSKEYRTEVDQERKHEPERSTERNS